jgi:predicted  nucleic acid-binding Zn-ribbon protein
MESFEQQFMKLNSDIDTLTSKIKNMEEKLETKTVAELPIDVEERIDSVEGKVAGIERTLKQLLPSLTNSIEELKNLVSEMKEKQNRYEKTSQPMKEEPAFSFGSSIIKPPSIKEEITKELEEPEEETYLTMPHYGETKKKIDVKI